MFDICSSHWRNKYFFKTQKNFIFLELDIGRYFSIISRRYRDDNDTIRYQRHGQYRRYDNDTITRVKYRSRYDNLTKYRYRPSLADTSFFYKISRFLTKPLISLRNLLQLRAFLVQVCQRFIKND